MKDSKNKHPQEKPKQHSTTSPPQPEKKGMREIGYFKVWNTETSCNPGKMQKLPTNATFINGIYIGHNLYEYFKYYPNKIDSEDSQAGEERIHRVFAPFPS